jgi:hypothetical protein
LFIECKGRYCEARVEAEGTLCDACVQRGEYVLCLRCDEPVREDEIDGKGACAECRSVPRFSCRTEDCLGKAFEFRGLCSECGCSKCGKALGTVLVERDGKLYCLACSGDDKCETAGCSNRPSVPGARWCEDCAEADQEESSSSADDVCYWCGKELKRPASYGRTVAVGSALFCDKKCAAAHSREKDASK